jgi:hypothetical protein
MQIILVQKHRRSDADTSHHLLMLHQAHPVISVGDQEMIGSWFSGSNFRHLADTVLGS